LGGGGALKDGILPFLFPYFVNLRDCVLQVRCSGVLLSEVYNYGESAVSTECGLWGVWTVGLWSVWTVECPVGVWTAECLGCGLSGLWKECLDFGVAGGLWTVWTVECLDCRISGLWSVWIVEFLDCRVSRLCLGCGVCALFIVSTME
jgi:hypothetical protein